MVIVISLSFKLPGPKYEDTSSSAEQVWDQKLLTFETLITSGRFANKGATITRLVRLFACTTLLVQYTVLCLKISVVIHAQLIALPLTGTAFLLTENRGQRATKKVTFAFTTQPNTLKGCGMAALVCQVQDLFNCDNKLTSSNVLHAPKPDT